jgi:D-sedoheptulose 7-phosphate isomerase
MNKFILSYKQKLTSLINDIDERTIQSVIDLFEENYSKGKKIYIIGNGGSAATGSHMVNDLGVGLARRGIRYFDIECLSDNTSVCTALANDIGYEHIFSMQLKNKISADDLLIAISCSGNSANIINAVTYAKEQKTKIIGLTGFDGGELKQLSDINFHIDTKKNEYGLVEDLHMIFDHMIYTYYIENKEKL